MITYFYLFILVISTSLEYILYRERQYGLYFYLFYFVYTALLVANHWLLLHLRSKPELIQKKESKNWRLIALTIAFIIVGWTNAWQEMQLRGVWTDEIASMQNALEIDWMSSAESSATYHQPPIDQQFLFLTGKLFGYQEWTVRSQTLTTLFFLLLIFPWILYWLTQSLALTFLGLILFLFNPYLSYYSIEARPLMLALLFLCLYLTVLNENLMQPNHRHWQVLLLIVTTLFLLTVNIQPVVFLFWFCIFLLMTHLKSLKNQWSIIGIHALATAIYLPVLYKTFARSQKLGQITDHPIQKMLQYFSDFNLDWGVFLSGNEVIFSAAAFVVLIAIIPAVKSKNSLFLPLTGALCFSSIHLDLLNRVFIEWPFYYRYIILISFLAIIVFVLSLKEIKTLLRKKIFLLVIVILAIYYPIANHLYHHWRLEQLHFCCSFQPDFMEFLKGNTQKEDHIIKLNLVEYGEWREDEWDSREIYMPRREYPQLKDPVKVMDLEDWPYQLIPFKEFQNQRVRTVYIVESKNRSPGLSKYWTDLPFDVQIFHFKFNTVYKFTFRQSQELSDYMMIYERLLTVPDSKLKGVPIEVLFYFSWKMQDIEKMKFYLNQLKDIFHHLDSSHPNLQSNAKKELQVKISQFEQLLAE